MIINNSKANDVRTEGIEETTKMSISLDKENEDHIIRVLTENYKYPIESLVRENYCNHWDSMLAVGKENEPIPVKLYRHNGQWLFETSDTGLGLNEEDFYKYYMGIGNSSKRNSNKFIGGFGCGAKAALSYTDSYEVICRKDGLEYKFLIFKGAERPECTKIYEKATEEGNGVIIKVPVDQYDYSEFSEAIRQQLCYFPTAFIDIGGNTSYANMKIFENELFRWSEMYPSNDMYISFGNVRYEISWDILKIPKINIPIAIKLPMDSDVRPFFNRESLQYSESTKEIIKQKIKDIAKWFVEKYNSEWYEKPTFIECYKTCDNLVRNVEIAGQTFRINELEEYSDVAPKLLKVAKCNIEQPFYYQKLASKMFQEYEKVAIYNSYTFKSKKLGYGDVFYHFEKNFKIIEVTKVPVGNFRKYILEKYPKQNLIFVTKYRNRKLGSVTRNVEMDYRYLLQLAYHDRKEWRARILEFQSLEQEFKSVIVDETAEYVPEKWLSDLKEERKANRGKRDSNYKGLGKIDGQVTLAWGRDSWAKDGVTFEKKAHNINELKNRHFLTIYGTSDQKELLTKAFKIVKNKIHVVIANQRELKHLENRHNFITIKDFMAGKSKEFGKIATAILFNQEVEKFKQIYKAGKIDDLKLKEEF